MRRGEGGYVPQEGHMIESHREWLVSMAELEDGHSISAGGSPFRVIRAQPPSTHPTEKDWLVSMTELENGLPISAGVRPFCASELERVAATIEE